MEQLDQPMMEDEQKKKKKKGLMSTLKETETPETSVVEETVEETPKSVKSPTLPESLDLNPTTADKAYEDTAALTKQAFADRDSDTTVKQAMDQYRAIKPTTLSPVDQKKYDDHIEELEDIYRAGRKSTNRKKVNAVVAQSLISLAGSIFAYKKGLSLGEVKFDNSIFDDQMNSLKEDLDRGTSKVNDQRAAAKEARRERQARLDQQFTRDREDARAGITRATQERDSKFTSQLGLADTLRGRGDRLSAKDDMLRKERQAQRNADRTFNYTVGRDGANDAFRNRQQSEIERNNRANNAAKNAANALKAKAAKNKGKQDKEKGEEQNISDIRQDFAKYQQVMNGIKGEDGKFSGAFDGTVRKWFDSLTGNKRAKVRKLAKEITLDETMKNVAKTKGAVSDREMALFAEPMPTDTEQDGVWLDWLQRKMIIQERAIYRIENGIDASSPEESKWFEEVAKGNYTYDAAPLHFSDEKQMEEVKRTTKDGKTAIFNSKTKEFIRYE